MQRIGGAILLAGLGVSASADAVAVVQTAVIAARPADWTGSFTFDKADPALGPVSNVTLAVTGTVSGRVEVENRDQTGRNLGSSLSGSVAVKQPNGADFVTANPNAYTNAELAAFDGSVDFGGASGRTFNVAPQSATASRMLARGSRPGGGGAVDSFVGTGTVELPVAGSVWSSVSAGGNVTGRVRADIGAEGTLTYTQDPAGVSSGGGGSGGGGFTFCCRSPSPKPQIATTEAQLRVIDPQVTGWRELLSFDAFDTSLGALWSVDLTLKTPISFSHRLENLGDSASGLVTAQTAGLSLARANGSAIGTVTGSYSTRYDVAAFDGTEDGSGASGGSAETDQTVTRKFVLDSDADGWAFGDGSPVELWLEGIGLSYSGGSNFWFDLSALAGAEVTLAYNYAVGPGTLWGTPQPDGTVAYDIHGRTVYFAVPAPAGLALIAPGLALLALRRRSRRPA